MKSIRISVQFRMKSKLLLIFIIFVSLVYLVLVVYFQYSIPENTREVNSGVRSILIWNGVNRVESAVAFGNGADVFVKNGCAFTECRIFVDRSALPYEQYDAVVMNMIDIYHDGLPEEKGFERQSHQRYVFLSQESPLTLDYLNKSEFHNYFNWTMSYRTDSDILLTYGRVHSTKSAPQSSGRVLEFIEQTHHWTKNFLTNKTKTVVWMASHCNTYSSRETYINELRKYIDVDIFGECGNLTCPRFKYGRSPVSPYSCYRLQARAYKFYLSFENSLCPDYVSEKLFHVLHHNMVPVVFGSANYSSLAPTHSYIDALKFTPRQLARYLHRVGNDKTLYNEFFWWKEHYQVEAGPEQMARHGFCDLCQKLHQDSSVKIYDNILTKWNWSICAYRQSWRIKSTDLHPFM